MFRRLKLFMEAVRASKKNGDVGSDIDGLMQIAGAEMDKEHSSCLNSNAEDLLLDPPFEQLYPDTPELTADHVAVLRQMRLSWNGAEVGAPQCEPTRSFAGGTASDLVRGLLGDISDEEVAAFMVSMVPAVNMFMQKATLDPGTYTLKNLDNDLLSMAKEGFDEPDALFQIGDDFTVTLTADDIKLCKGATWEWPYEDDMYDALARGDIAGPTVDPKRPYGEMSYIDLDIHRLLGWPVESRDTDGDIEISDEQATRASELHFRQLGTMQAFLENAVISL